MRAAGRQPLEGLIPPVVQGPSFCIRKRASRIFTLDDYVAAGAMTPRQRDLIGEAALEHQNILIVGGTGLGKTTLVNAVIHLIAEELAHERLLILEDTAEIQCAATNHVFKRTTNSIDLRRLLRSTMRYRPDRIVVGEVRGGECLDLLKAWNTGHPGGVATVHANDALGGLIRLENLVAEATPAPMQKTIATAIDLIAVIAKTTACKAGLAGPRASPSPTPGSAARPPCRAAGRETVSAPGFSASSCVDGGTAPRSPSAASAF